MTQKRQPHPKTDGTAALLALCRAILACEKDLAAGAALVRPHLSSGADPSRVTPDLQRQAEEALRLQGLVHALGEALQKTRIAPEMQDEMRKALQTAKACLARLAGQTEEDYALTSRRGVRIPGVGGRPYPRRR